MDSSKKSTRNEFKILHWNANGLTQHSDELKDLLDRQKVDVALISETHLSQKKKLKIPGMSIYRRDRTQNTKAAGGTAIIIRNNVVHSQIELENLNHLEANAVLIELENHTKINIVAMYKKPKANLEEGDLKAMLNLKYPTLAAGDINSKHTDWGCKSINQNGRRLKTYLENNPWMLCAPDQPTHIGRNQDYNSDILDIVLMKDFPYNLKQEVLQKLNSDHLPVLITMTLKVKHQELSTPIQTNWVKFRESINKVQIKTPMVVTEGSIDSHV